MKDEDLKKLQDKVRIGDLIYTNEHYNDNTRSRRAIPIAVPTPPPPPKKEEK
ncbi:hypothetical protein N5D48_05120 [Pseudomonas sp. GD03858]|uniref:hypothetical protein n=1 Tax=unclassified Pseudomonas TaxID=196821 RepID=UPI00244BFB78|nr:MULTISPECIES: hypothetical protein [unclassified Pseudomonas]MDH0646226.1 hypothetical protein [Pseudomonas sp. GD03867]MDH0661775.1 hypothetical protein [Pseudomonas sp. GD03858]